MQPHELQKMQILVLLALLKIVYPASLSILQLSWLPRNAVLRRKRNDGGKSETVEPIFALTICSNTHSAMLCGGDTSLYGGLPDLQTLCLGK